MDTKIRGPKIIYIFLWFLELLVFFICERLKAGLTYFWVVVIENHLSDTKKLPKFFLLFWVFFFCFVFHVTQNLKFE